jgi:S1-C subfamily serine protease
MVKIYGAGGVRGLEAYQSGFLISGQGHILTVWSYVLDTDYVTCTLNDGRKMQAELVGFDPRLEIAVLKIDAEDLSFFNLNDAAELQAGSRVLAFSNLYGVATGNEPTSVLHGSVSVKTSLEARRGAFATPYKGEAYILDAMTNNPGAAGGALTDNKGRLAGILGKELRNSLSNTWLNYSIPVAEFVQSADDIMSGKTLRARSDEAEDKPVDPLTLAALGVVLVPDVLNKTPPFVDKVERESLAEAAGLRPDDLILFVNNRVIGSCMEVMDEFSYLDRLDEVRITVQRGQELVDLRIQVDE